MAAEKLISRAEQKKEDCWALEDLYKKEEEWEEDFAKIGRMAEEIRKERGTLADSPKHCFDVLKKRDQLQQLLEKVYVYAAQQYHTDTGNGHYQALSSRASVLMNQAGDKLSFIEPEILEISFALLEEWMEDYEPLRLYRRYFEEQFRQKEHILTKEMEEILARAADLGQGPGDIFSMFNNADLTFGEITGEDGRKEQLTHGRYIKFLESQDRSVRKEAFDTLYKAYGSFRNTLAAAFYANVKQEYFFARTRKYSSSRAMALDGGNIPERVYDGLIEAVHGGLPAMYRYVRLRKRALQVEELHMYDLHVPLVKEGSRRIPFAEAKETVKKGLAVLGEDYGRILEEGFSSRWIDVYENQGKRSGAYSWGAYGTHPYVLLNYAENLNNVFTLAHEMGHAIHSYYSDQTQPYPYAGYRIFVAEVASTCNEALLIRYMIDHAADDQERAYLINYFLDQFKGTVYRQTMFAEFEKEVHERAAQGEALTADLLCSLYYDLNKKYFGEEMTVDEAIALEWARIPHFYTPFYVYQYATGFSAAIAISRKILSGEPGAVEHYKEFLKGGSSMDPIDLLKLAGVDMTSPEPVQEALRTFEEYVQELEKLL
mgnify:CR=1 FL=1